MDTNQQQSNQKETGGNAPQSFDAAGIRQMWREAQVRSMVGKEAAGAAPAAVPPASLAPEPEPEPAADSISAELSPAKDTKTEPIAGDTSKEPLAPLEVRTLRNDAELYTKSMGIVTAEAPRPVTTIKPRMSIKEQILAGATIALMLVSIVGIITFYRWYIDRSRNVPVETYKVKGAIIEADSSREIDVRGAGRDFIDKEVRNAINGKIAAGTVLYMDFYEPAKSNGSDFKLSINTDELMSRIEAKVPPILSRSFTPSYMFGIRSYGAFNHPFLIIKTSFYENAFSGMLEWEKNLPDDLSFMIDPIALSEYKKTSAGTGKLLFANMPPFEDKVISNRDARILSANGRVMLMYAFADKNTLVITTGEETLRDIFRRLVAARLVR